MRYMKIFEEFGTNPFSEGYSEIGEEEFDILIGTEIGVESDDKWGVLTKEEIKKILKYFPFKCEHHLEKWEGNQKEYLCIFEDNNLYITIYKLNDEWWVVDENQDIFDADTTQMIDNHTYYKCDQFDALVSLLNGKKYFS